MNKIGDGQKARSFATQRALMHTAEQLIAEKGIQNVTKREITKAAGQKNESVLQYHFKNLEGLISAIIKARSVQTQEKRAELLDQLLSETAEPTLRDICKLMILPSYLLAKADLGYSRYIRAFSLETAITSDSAYLLIRNKGAGGESGRETARLLRNMLLHLDESAYERRIDSAIRFVSISMNHQARAPKAFKAADAELFINSLIDALHGLLNAPVSDETLAWVKSFASKK